MCYGTVKSPWSLTLRCFLCNAFECLMAFLQSELMMQDTQFFYSHKLSQVQQLVLISQQCVASRCSSRKTKHQTSFSIEDKVFSHGKCCLFIALKFDVWKQDWSENTSLLCVPCCREFGISSLVRGWKKSCRILEAKASSPFWPFIVQSFKWFEHFSLSFDFFSVFRFDLGRWWATDWVLMGMLSVFRKVVWVASFSSLAVFMKGCFPESQLLFAIFFLGPWAVFCDFNLTEAIGGKPRATGETASAAASAVGQVWKSWATCGPSRAPQWGEFRMHCSWMIVIAKCHNMNNMFVVYVFVFAIVGFSLCLCSSLCCMSEFCSNLLCLPQTGCKALSSQADAFSQGQVWNEIRPCFSCSWCSCMKVSYFN